MTPTCPHSPAMARTAFKLGLQSVRVKVDVIEVSEFPQLAPALDIRVVPDRPSSTTSYATPGVIDEVDLVQALLLAAEGKDVSASSRRPGTVTSLVRPSRARRAAAHLRRAASSSPASRARLTPASLDADLSRPLAFALLGLVFLLPAPPFLNYGHGTDPDAWRVALTAHHLLDTGEYFPSRLPGNPLHELRDDAVHPRRLDRHQPRDARSPRSPASTSSRASSSCHELPNAGAARHRLRLHAAALHQQHRDDGLHVDAHRDPRRLLLPAHAAGRSGPASCSAAPIGFRLQSFIVWLPLAFLAWRARAASRDIVPLSLAAGGVAAALLRARARRLRARLLQLLRRARQLPRTSSACSARRRWASSAASASLAGLLISLPRFRSLPADLRHDTAVGAWAVDHRRLLRLLLAPAPRDRLPDPGVPLRAAAHGALLHPRSPSPAPSPRSSSPASSTSRRPATSSTSASIRTATHRQGARSSRTPRRWTRSASSSREVMSRRRAGPLGRHDGLRLPAARRARARPPRRPHPRARLRRASACSPTAARPSTRRATSATSGCSPTTPIWRCAARATRFFMVPDAARSTAALYDYRPACSAPSTCRLDLESPDRRAAARQHRPLDCRSWRFCR